MPAPSTVAFASGDLDYIVKLNQLVADVNATFAAYLATTAGALFSGSSVTSNSITVASKSFVLTEAAQRGWGVGTPLRIADSAAPSTNYMDGSITSYAHPNVTVNVTAITGSGTKTAWNLSMSAISGIVPVASGGTGAADAATARTNLGLGTAATSASSAFATAAQGTTADAALPKAGGTMSGAVLMGNNTISGLKNLSFNAEYNAGDSGAAIAITWTNGQQQKTRLTANTTITVNTPAAPGHYQLRIVQDATGARTVTWAGALYLATRWGGSGSAPALNTTANGECIVSFYYDGTTMTQTLFRIGMA